MDYTEAKQIFLEVADEHEVDWMSAEEHGVEGSYKGQDVETLYDDIKMLGPQLGTPEWYHSYLKDEETLYNPDDYPDNCIAVLVDREIGYVGFIAESMTEAEVKELLINEIFQPIPE